MPVISQDLSQSSVFARLSLTFLLFLFCFLFASHCHGQTYQTVRDSGQRAYDALRFEDAIKQFEAAEVLARDRKNERQLSEINGWLAKARSGYIDAILREKKRADRALNLSDSLLKVSDSLLRVSERRAFEAEVLNLASLGQIVADDEPLTGFSLGMKAVELAEAVDLSSKEQIYASLEEMGRRHYERGMLHEQTKAIWRIQFSSEQQLLFTTSDDLTTVVWDFNTNEILSTLIHPDTVNVTILGNNGSTLFTGDIKGNIHSWDPFSGKLNWSQNLGEFTSYGKPFVRDLVLLKDTHELVACPGGNSIAFFDANTGEFKKKVTSYFRSFWHLSSDIAGNQLILQQTKDNYLGAPWRKSMPPRMIQARLMNGSKKGKRLRNKRIRHRISAFDSSPNGNYLAIRNYSYDQEKDKLFIHNLSDFSLISTIESSYHIHGFTFMNDDKKIATINLKGEIEIWDTETGNRLWKYPYKNQIWNAIAYIHTSSGPYLVTGGLDGKTVIWDANVPVQIQFISSSSDDVIAFCSTKNNDIYGIDQNGKILKGVNNRNEFEGKKLNISPVEFEHPGPGFSIDISFNDSLLITTGSKNSIIWNTANGKKERVIHHPFRKAGIAVRWLSNNEFIIGSQASASIWSLDKKRRLKKLKFPIQGHSQFELSSLRRFIAVVDNKNVFFYPLNDLNSEGLKFGSFPNVVSSISFSSNDSLIGIGTEQGDIFLCDVASKNKLFNLRGHTTTIIASAFSKDGRYFLAASNNYNVVVWDITTKEKVQELNLNPFYAQHAEFSSDGQTVFLALGDGIDVSEKYGFLNMKRAGKGYVLEWDFKKKASENDLYKKLQQLPIPEILQEKLNQYPIPKMP